jgi:hypothetical protein
MEAKRTQWMVKKKYFLSEANIFIWCKLNIEAKRSKLILNWESSETKRTCSMVKNLFRSEANMFIWCKLNIEAKRSKLILNWVSSEAKRTCRTCSIVKKFISKRSEQVYNVEFKYPSEANSFMLWDLNIEAKQSKLILNCMSSEAKRA